MTNTLATFARSGSDRGSGVGVKAAWRTSERAGAARHLEDLTRQRELWLARSHDQVRAIA